MIHIYVKTFAIIPTPSSGSFLEMALDILWKAKKGESVAQDLPLPLGASFNVVCIGDEPYSLVQHN